MLCLKVNVRVCGFLTIILALGLLPVTAAAGSKGPGGTVTTDEWKGAYGPYVPGEYSTLPHDMTPEEQLQWKLRRPTLAPSTPPPPPVRNVAEFERMQGVLIRYPLGISYSLVREMSLNAIVYTIVSSDSVQSQAISNFTANGVNMANVQFIMAPTDSIYTRDYGPWAIFEGTDTSGIIDVTYNRPRPNDDAIPGIVSAYLGEPMFTMDLIASGGNYMTDGMGISVSTDLIVSENPDKTPTEIKQTVKDFLGVHTYHIVPDTTGTYIKHVDTWVKFLTVDRILIRRVPPSHPHYADTEAAVNYFASHISSYGTPYQIYRVDTPNDEPYVNSLILNDKALVPIVNTAWDDDALAAYQAAMPGYQVLGFTGSWLSTDALHCRVMGIPDAGMLYVLHYPVVTDQPVGQPIEIRATVVPYSGQALQSGSPVIHWKTSATGAYTSIPMTPVAPDEYQGFIPAQVSAGNVFYYIHAADNSGRSENHPFIGAPDPHVITIAGGGGASADLVITELGTAPISVAAGDYVQATYRVANVGTVTVIEPYTERVYLSTTPMLDETAVPLVIRQGGWEPVLEPGETFAVTLGLSIPAGLVPGSYFLLVQADTLGTVTESIETNNVSAVPLTVTAPSTCPEGIAITNLAPGEVSPQVSFTGTWASAGGDGSGLVSAGAGLDTYTWTTPVLSAMEACTYRVMVTWQWAPTRSTAVPYTVSGPTGGPATKTVNQQEGQSFEHGTYTFPAGVPGQVMVSDINGEASARSVHFFRVDSVTTSTAGAPGDSSPPGKQKKEKKHRERL